MDSDLQWLFAYPARTGILETLYHQPGELGLRQAAAIAGVYPRSAELALKDLQKDRLVRRRKAGARVFFSLNRGHPAYPMLASVFAAAAACRTRQKNLYYKDVGREVSSFISGALQVMNKARISYHGARRAV